MYFNIWRGIDALAKSKGLSASGLARLSGLNPTSFNKSKRVTAAGRQRWLNMESLNKVLEATHTSFLDFMVLCGERERRENQILPLVNIESPEAVFDESGYPERAGQYISFPDTYDKKLFALEVLTDMFAPFYRKGDKLIISPGCELRCGDRVVLKLKTDSFRIFEFVSENFSGFNLSALNGEKICSFKKNEVVSVGRILWAGQG